MTLFAVFQANFFVKYGQSSPQRGTFYGQIDIKNLDIRYNRLYLADVDDLFVCNLDDGLKESSRLVRYQITQDQRKTFYLEAARRQKEARQDARP